ncbi:MAG: hypothetical protein LBC65_02290 [Oscillospiraceae bacterium]|nr:hypothetical protein [Oscillospiraceae bacterium]
MKRKSCTRHSPAKPLGIALLGTGTFILAVVFLPPGVWVIVTAAALIGGGVAVLKKK